MPSFNYAKISSESSRKSSNEELDTHPESARQNAWSKFHSTLQHFRWPLSLLLLGAILACELLILAKQVAPLPIGSELNSLLPTFSQERKLFGEDHRFLSDHKTLASINTTKQHWLSLMPPGSGFLHIPHPQTHTLPPAMHFASLPNQNIYSIAVFHQLHCLHSLSHFTDTLLLRLHSRDFSPLSDADTAHNDHCVTYIRNAIMCAADTTMEGQAPGKGPEREPPGTDGTGAVHICRSFEEVAVWAGAHGIAAGREGKGMDVAMGEGGHSHG